MESQSVVKPPKETKKCWKVPAWDQLLVILMLFSATPVKGELPQLPGAGSSDGTGIEASFTVPSGLAIDSNANIYLTDTFDDLIRKITPGGLVTTIAGRVSVSSYQDGQGTNAEFDYPDGITVTTTGVIYVSDAVDGLIREISPTGLVTTFAGGFDFPAGIHADTVGNLLVADSNNCVIKKITPAGVVTTFAGTTPCDPAATLADGTGTNAVIYEPLGLTVDSMFNVYVYDAFPSVRKITPAAVVTTVAGGTSGYQDGTGTVAEFENGFLPFASIAVDKTGTLYVTDTGNWVLRKITPTGVVTTFAGNHDASLAFGARRLNAGAPTFWADGHGTNAGTPTFWADGHATNAVIASPLGIVVDTNGYLYVSDFSNQIRKVSPTGLVTTIAGDHPTTTPEVTLEPTAEPTGHPSGQASDSMSRKPHKHHYVSRSPSFGPHKRTKKNGLRRPA